jgi:hypothetical protein
MEAMAVTIPISAMIPKEIIATVIPVLSLLPAMVLKASLNVSPNFIVIDEIYTPLFSKKNTRTEDTNIAEDSIKYL